MSVSVKDYSEILSSVQEVITKAWGADVNFDESTPTGQFTANLAAALLELYTGLQASYDASRADQATGQQLDDLASLLNIKRNDGFKTVCKSCTLTGTDSTIIPQGTRAKTTDGIVFESAVEATITGTTATVDFVSQEPGNFTVAVGALDSIVDAVAGWSAITNPTAGTGGEGDQSDASLRQDILTRSQNLASGLQGSIRAGVEGVSGVKQAYVYVNYSGVTAPAPYLTPPFSVLTVVQYDDVSIENDIANAIYLKLPAAESVNSPAGGTQKSVNVNVNGYSWAMKWNQAAETALNFVVELEQLSTFTDQDRQNLEDAITNYVKDNALIAGKIVYSHIYNAMLDAVPDAVVLNFYMSTNVTPTTGDDVSLTANFWETYTTGIITVQYGS